MPRLIPNIEGTVIRDDRLSQERLKGVGTPDAGKVVVSILVHAPKLEDPLIQDGFGPFSMAGGMSIDVNGTVPGRLARLSQWDFGLTVGALRLLDEANDAGVPAAVALDKLGCEQMPGLAAETSTRAAEVVCRGWSANRIIDPGMTEADEAFYIRESMDAVSVATDHEVRGWISPEGGTTMRTPRLLKEAGVEWFGDWSSDDWPLELTGDAKGLTAVPYARAVEDMFSLYVRGMDITGYEEIVERTLRRLLEESRRGEMKFLGVNWHGWVLGQACFAETARSFLHAIASSSEVECVTPSEFLRRLGAASLGSLSARY